MKRAPKKGCPDCRECQQCGESRCRQCLKGGHGGSRTVLGPFVTRGDYLAWRKNRVNVCTPCTEKDPA